MGLFKKSAKIKKCYKFIATYGYKIDPNNKTGASVLKAIEEAADTGMRRDFPHYSESMDFTNGNKIQIDRHIESADDADNLEIGLFPYLFKKGFSPEISFRKVPGGETPVFSIGRNEICQQYGYVEIGDSKIIKVDWYVAVYFDK